jgi:hypothetical protein
MVKDIWLLSSKDIEELAEVKGNLPRIINRNNSEIYYDIFDVKYNQLNKTISLGTFYYDLCETKNESFIDRSPRYLNGAFKINQDHFSQEKIIETLKKRYNNNISEESSLLSFNIWKLKYGNEEFPVYFTRCFPNKEKFITDFGTISQNYDYLRYYWLIAYFETICMIEGIDLQSIDNYLFRFLVHDSDVGKTNLLGCFNLSQIFSSINFFDSVAPHFKLISVCQ